MSFLDKVETFRKNGKISDDIALLLRGFYQSYQEALAVKNENFAHLEPVFLDFLQAAANQVKKPHIFESYHHRIRSPIDYYQLGLNMFRPMVNFSKSQLVGKENISSIEKQLALKDNVFLLANHQTELDPQVLSLLLEKKYAQLAEELIFVAGHLVVTDPMAIPFSLGRNLICIYSKRHIENPPEKKEEKLRQNQRAMRRMEELLHEGGKCIYIAPSGGRDRRNSQGEIEVAPFDAQSLEMLFLIAKKVGAHSTHFYPLSLYSYPLLPPSRGITSTVGEWRQTCYTPLHAYFGQEIDIDQFPGHDIKDKQERRQARANYIWGLVNNQYQELIKYG